MRLGLWLVWGSLVLSVACSGRERQFGQGGDGGHAGESSAVGEGAIGGEEATPNSGGGGSDAGSGGESGTVGSSTTPSLDAPCTEEDALGCNGAAQKVQLVCQQGTWRFKAVCAADENCAQANASCVAIPSACSGREPGSTFCVDSKIERCDIDLTAVEQVDVCAGKCVQLQSAGQCALATCGDGKVQAGEDCDDGNTEDTDACPSSCHDAKCGDGAAWADHETCDDGNASDTDACTSKCEPAKCGDGFVLPGTEQCDDGNTTDTDGCTNACKAAVCGDGIVQTGKEQCDDANSANGDACTNACQTAVCGDGVTHTGTEQCDDGNSVETDGCTSACKLPSCGDGKMQPGEVCDDGNSVDTDACTNSCQNAKCGDGSAWVGKEACDDGNSVDTDTCTNACTAAKCGDGIVQSLKDQCDDGNQVNTDTCTNACTAAKCGDGFVQAAEQCDDGNSVTSDACANDCKATPAVPLLNLSFASKRLLFSWSAVARTDYYQLNQSKDGGVTFQTTGGHLTGTTTSVDVAVYFYDWANQRYRIDACNTLGCSPSNVVDTAGASVWAIGYLKASNPEANDSFGTTVALSPDGATLAVGTTGEDSAAKGIGGSQTDNSASSSGAVYVFTRTGSTWSQQAYIKASNGEASDFFGYSLALSSDGNTLAVGAFGEDSATKGIEGVQTDNAAANSGAVYVFTRTGSAWAQQAYIKASNTEASDSFGQSVALSGDGNTLAVGAVGESSAAKGIAGSQTDNTASFAGAVYVFTRSGSAWGQQAYVKASNTSAASVFGHAVALNSDGNTLAVGAPGESSASKNVGGLQTDTTAPNAGAVYVFTRSSTTWLQQAYVKASNTDASDYFGDSVALSADGNTLAVGADGEDSGSSIQTDNTVQDSGAVYVYTRAGSAWSQQAYIKASNPNTSDVFGDPVALSADGNTLAVAASGESSAAQGIAGSQSDNAAENAGAVYVYTRSGSTWSSRAYVKASNTEASDYFSASVALSADGNTLAVGADGEDSSAMGVGGNQISNAAARAGAVYLY
jgi:cysteine-rich repeat protein